MFDEFNVENLKNLISADFFYILFLFKVPQKFFWNTYVPPMWNFLHLYLKLYYLMSNDVAWAIINNIWFTASLCHFLEQKSQIRRNLANNGGF